MTAAKPIPCNIIAGPLGVGKTSAILNYLRKYASTQRVGVLVNDFGPVGLDSTTVAAEAPKTNVINVPGGCICCTMLADLPKCINRLTAEQDIDRIIIEPSGMAAPEQVIKALQSTQDELNIRVQPAIIMMSAKIFDEETFERMPYLNLFCKAADILVFNRCDQASEAKVEQATQWAAKLDPPKLRVLTASHGDLPADVFDTAHAGCDHSHIHSHSHDNEHEHSHDHDDHDHDHDPTIHPGGVVLSKERRFDQQLLFTNLKRLCSQHVEGNEVLRLKGVFHTKAGFQAIEIADGSVSSRPSAHRGDSRIEWLTKPGAVDEPTMLHEIERPTAH